MGNEVKGVQMERVLAFREYLLGRYHAKSPDGLPPGPQQDFRRAAERAGMSPGFVDKEFFDSGRQVLNRL